MKIIKKQRLPIRFQIRDKKFVQMIDPVSKLPLTEHDSLTLKDFERAEIIIVETTPHKNYLPSKKALFKPIKAYYISVV